MSEETFQNTMAPYNPNDAETRIPQTFRRLQCPPPFNPEFVAPSPFEASRFAEQQVPDLDDDDDLLCYNRVLFAYSDHLQ
eukprot:10827290-Lingulodinium_polyedra.AAC.1